MNEQRGRLTAELSLTSQARSVEDVSAIVVLRNSGTAPLRLDLWPLRSPSLVLEIHDASDRPVRLPPPPVPGGGSEPLVLAPGDTTRLEYHRFLPPWIERGDYRVRFRFTNAPVNNSDAWAGRVESDWQNVAID